MKNTSELRIDENVVCDTSFLGVIKISGDDAQTFLQGQFSNDVDLLQENNSQLSSYNSPKGRMYASFRLFKNNHDFYMLLPKDIIASMVKRLKMFVMRSKVTIEDLTAVWTSLGLSGVSVAQEIRQFPAETDASHHENQITFIHVPGLENRLLLVGPSENLSQFKERLSEVFIHTSSAHWKRLDICAGLPNIYSTTTESFVAQMVNLQLINGVSFTKGCYPGQEVVARMHYLGKLKKRMYRIIIEGTSAPIPGDNIYLSENKNIQSVGQIVDTQLNNHGSIDALAVIQNSAVESEHLRVKSSSHETNHAIIKIVDLPYADEEPTA